MKTLIKSLFTFLCVMSGWSSFGQDKPNIIWIYAEDTSPWMGCYGDEINKDATPNIDRIANSGVRFNRAYVPAPVCSATRSAMMVGQSAIRFGGQEHRSSRKEETRIYLPEGYKLLPQIMKENGYVTYNHGKTDYNYAWDKEMYTTQLKKKVDFSELVNQQPFFGQIQTKGGKNNTTKFPQNRKVNPSEVTVAADYPNNEVFQKWFAQHYDAIRKDDYLIGEILKGLKEAGLDKNTIVVYFSDHGANNLLRHKQMTTEGGLHVPFMVMGPEQYVPKGEVRNDLVSMLDLTATTLAWAGITQPEWYEGQNLFAKEFTPRTVVGGHKDRLDQTIDQVRSIRTEDYRYVRNYHLDRIFLQPQYRDKKEYTKNIRALYANGELSQLHKDIYFGERQPEELYNVTKDPEMIHNLANDLKFKKELKKHRKLMDEWLAKGDMGEGDESIAELKANGENKPWGEGMNPEYEVYRDDSDGDGISDKLETLLKRDPKDGLLLFTFDNGGWQTEGWNSDDISSNLAGYLGYLDFTLDKKEGSITRDGLKVTASKKDQSYDIKLKADHPLEVILLANNQVIGMKHLSKENTTQTLSFKLDNAKWEGEINSLTVVFKGKKGTTIEMDFMSVKRESSSALTN
ncbi:sulfatase [Flammeovirga sp. SubArs3]|uniref:sulfatase family protein n=1 Tax=Flammeovirga sp. SubArs3 TaxID=2995316 RepID=UPI00248D21E1|nr:sulfatase [Flammeovirga sp. SubArs3]